MASSSSGSEVQDHDIYDDWLLPSIGRMKLIRDRILEEVEGLITKTADIKDEALAQSFREVLDSSKEHLSALFLIDDKIPEEDQDVSGSLENDKTEYGKFVCAFLGESGTGKSFLINILLLMTLVDKYCYESMAGYTNTPSGGVSVKTRSLLSNLIEGVLKAEKLSSEESDKLRASKGLKGFFDIVTSDDFEAELEDASYLLPSNSTGDATTNQTIRIRYGELFSLLVVYQNSQWAAEEIDKFHETFVEEPALRDISLDDFGGGSKDEINRTIQRYAALVGWEVENLKEQLRQYKGGNEGAIFPTEMCSYARDFIGKSFCYEGLGKSLEADLHYVKTKLNEICGPTSGSNIALRHLIKSVTLLVPSSLLQCGLEILDVPGTDHNDSLNRSLQQEALNEARLVVCCLDVNKNLGINNSVIDTLKRSEFLQHIRASPKSYRIVLANISDRRIENPEGASKRLERYEGTILEKIFDKNRAEISELLLPTRIRVSGTDPSVLFTLGPSDEHVTVCNLLHVSPRIFAFAKVRGVLASVTGKEFTLDTDQLAAKTNFDMLLNILSHEGGSSKRKDLLLMIEGMKQQLRLPVSRADDLSFLNLDNPDNGVEAIRGWRKPLGLAVLMESITNDIDIYLKSKFETFSTSASTVEIDLEKWAAEASSLYKGKTSVLDWNPQLWAEVTYAIKGQSKALDLFEVLFGDDVVNRNQFVDIELIKNSLVQGFRVIIQEFFQCKLPEILSEKMPGLETALQKDLFVHFWQDHVFPRGDIVGGPVEHMMNRLQSEKYIYKKVPALNAQNLWKFLQDAKDSCIQALLSEMRKKNPRLENRIGTRRRAAHKDQDWHEIHEDISSYIKNNVPNILLKSFQNKLDRNLRSAEKAIRDLILRSGAAIRVLRQVLKNFVEYLTKKANVPGKKSNKDPDNVEKFEEFLGQLERWEEDLRTDGFRKETNSLERSIIIHFLDNSIHKDRYYGAQVEIQERAINVAERSINVNSKIRLPKPKVFPHCLEDVSVWLSGIEGDSAKALGIQMFLAENDLMVENAKPDSPTIFEALAVSFFGKYDPEDVKLLKKFCILNILHNFVPAMSKKYESRYRYFQNYTGGSVRDFVKKLMKYKELSVPQDPTATRFSAEEFQAILVLASYALRVNINVWEWEKQQEVPVIQHRIWDHESDREVPELYLFYFGDHVWKSVGPNISERQRPIKKRRLDTNIGNSSSAFQV